MPRCVTVLRTLQRGDLLYVVPALRAVRAALPRVEIVLFGLSWTKSLAQHFDHYLDGLLELPGYPGLREAPA
jgi:ADP-heptose:LPS heptosyltransferase